LAITGMTKMKHKKKKTTLNDVNQNLRIGRALQSIRSVSRVSQIKLAEILNTEQSAISRIEKGTQNLSLYELHLICLHFDVRADEFLRNEIDYWRLAEKFGTPAPYPERYTRNPFVRYRQVSPLLEALSLAKGEAFKERILADMNFENFLVRHPDQKIGTWFELDLLEKIETSKISVPGLMPSWTSMSLTRKCLGDLHTSLSNHHSKKDAILGWYLNADLFESNFEYDIRLQGESELRMDARPGHHFAEGHFRDHEQSHYLCDSRKSILEQIPTLSGLKTVKIHEDQCYFQGAESCTYRIAV